MNTHTDPTTDWEAYEDARPAREIGQRLVLQHNAPRIPEWRRRSMEGRGRFDAVTDTTGLVAL
jgi:hypothetical protein